MSLKDTSYQFCQQNFSKTNKQQNKLSLKAAEIASAKGIQDLLGSLLYLYSNIARYYYLYHLLPRCFTHLDGTMRESDKSTVCRHK